MPVTDYIYQQETVLKKDFGAWLIAKMQAAGWQQIGSNPPQSANDTTQNRAYIMKGKRTSDNLETIIGINDFAIRTRNSASYSMQMNIVPFSDYTPGTAGTVGTTSRSAALTQLNIAASTNAYQWTIAGLYSSSQYPADTPLNVRFCITPYNVSLVVRTPVFYNDKGGYLFFGLPDTLAKEKTTGSSIVTGSFNGSTANSNFYIVDTPLGIPSLTNPTDILTSYSMDPPRSPDSMGNFPFIIVYGGDTASGLRLRHPSAFFLKNGGLLDGDLIIYQGMTFEILDPNGKMGNGFLSGFVAYRVA